MLNFLRRAIGSEDGHGAGFHPIRQCRKKTATCLDQSTNAASCPARGGRVRQRKVGQAATANLMIDESI